MPTLALIDNQYQWIKKYDILLVVLIANLIAANPTVWKEVETRNYAVVFTSTEVLF